MCMVNAWLDGGRELWSCEAPCTWTHACCSSGAPEVIDGSMPGRVDGRIAGTHMQGDSLRNAPPHTHTNIRAHAPPLPPPNSHPRTSLRLKWGSWRTATATPAPAQAKVCGWLRWAAVWGAVGWVRGLLLRGLSHVLPFASHQLAQPLNSASEQQAGQRRAAPTPPPSAKVAAVARRMRASACVGAIKHTLCTRTCLPAAEAVACTRVSRMCVCGGGSGKGRGAGTTCVLARTQTHPHVPPPPPTPTQTASPQARRVLWVCGCCPSAAAAAAATAWWGQMAS